MNKLNELAALVLSYGEMIVEYLAKVDVLVQIGLISVFYVFALLLAKRYEPPLEERARKIKGMPGLLRVVVVFLRRLKWLFFVVLLALAYGVMEFSGWPPNIHMVYAAMMLAWAWLLISVVSHAIRNRLVGKVFAVVVWMIVAATILGVTGDAVAILDGVGFNIGDFRLSLLGVIKAVLFVSVLAWLAFAIGNFLDQRIQRIDELTPSLRVLFGKILRISLMVFAVMIAMQGLNIDLTALTVLSGAIGVGIGFGLQKVVSNFISGIIILLDESIKPGDTITLGETFGWIRELRARFVSVVTRDGREYLIPNEDFITTQVINWSFSDKFVRLDVPFGVSYDSDPHEVTRLAIESAGAVDRVDTGNYKPVCWITEFGDSSINFLLRFWIEDPQMGLTNIRGKVLMALWDSFKEHDIKIPYPHREVIMKTPIDVKPQEQ